MDTRPLPLRIFLASVALACGGAGDGGVTSPIRTGKPPELIVPASGSRTLALTSVSGVAVPSVYYRSPDKTYDAWADSGTATIQADSTIVFRSYRTVIYPSGANEVSGQSTAYVASGRITVAGNVILTYTNGAAPDSAIMDADGALLVRFRNHESGDPDLSLGDWTFVDKYKGVPLNPMPSIQTLSPDSTVQYGSDFTITITGSGFVPASTVVWAGAVALPVVYVSPTQLTVKVPASFLNSAASNRVFVVNPEPGGGSAYATFNTANPVPHIASLTPAIAATGSVSISALIDGIGFNPHSIVQVNGSVRQSNPVSATRVQLSLPASDLAAAGVLQITVRNPAPGGGLSESLPFTVAGDAPKLISEVISPPLGAAALAADPTRPLIYAALPSTATAQPNTVVAIDVGSGSIIWSVPVAGSPNVLAISDDGQFLYVGQRHDPNIVRITLATHSPDITIPLGSPSYYASVIAVSPGNPRTIAVGREINGAWPSNVGVTIYDDSVARPSSTPGHDYPSSFVFGGSPALIYGYNGISSSFEFYNLAIDTMGATNKAVRQNVLSAYGLGLVYASGKIYVSDGSVIDPSTQSVVGRLAGFKVSGSLVPGSDGQVIYTVNASGTVIAADAKTYTALGSVAIADASGGASSIVRWGQDGIAFIANGRVFMVRADFIH